MTGGSSVGRQHGVASLQAKLRWSTSGCPLPCALTAARAEQRSVCICKVGIQLLVLTSR